MTGKRQPSNLGVKKSRAGPKPGSVLSQVLRLEKAVIYLGRLLPDASSGTH